MFFIFIFKLSSLTALSTCGWWKPHFFDDQSKIFPPHLLPTSRADFNCFDSPPFLIDGIVSLSPCSKRHSTKNCVFYQIKVIVIRGVHNIIDQHYSKPSDNQPWNSFFPLNRMSWQSCNLGLSSAKPQKQQGTRYDRNGVLPTNVCQNY